MAMNVSSRSGMIVNAPAVPLGSPSQCHRSWSRLDSIGAWAKYVWISEPR
jgi:hypothetical protein